MEKSEVCVNFLLKNMFFTLNTHDVILAIIYLFFETRELPTSLFHYFNSKLNNITLKTNIHYFFSKIFML